MIRVQNFSNKAKVVSRTGAIFAFDLNLYFGDLHDQLMPVKLRCRGNRDAISVLREQKLLPVVKPFHRLDLFGKREGIAVIGVPLHKLNVHVALHAKVVRKQIVARLALQQKVLFLALDLNPYGARQIHRLGADIDPLAKGIQHRLVKRAKLTVTHRTDVEQEIRAVPSAAAKVLDDHFRNDESILRKDTHIRL